MEEEAVRFTVASKKRGVSIGKGQGKMQPQRYTPSDLLPPSNPQIPQFHCLPISVQGLNPMDEIIHYVRVILSKSHLEKCLCMCTDEHELY